jgi:hypothetical protein
MGGADHARLFAKAAKGEFDFTNEQAVQLSTSFRAMMLSFEDQCLLRKLSLIDEMQLDTQERGLRVMLQMPALRTIWNMTRDGYSPKFVAYVEADTLNVPLSPPHDYAEQLKAAMAEVRAAAAK